jgi:hypothetical protein
MTNSLNGSHDMLTGETENKLMNKLVVMVLLCLGCLMPAEAKVFYPIAGENEHFPIFDDLSVPRPAGHRHYQPEEFKIDLAKVKRSDGKLLFGGRDELFKLAQFYSEDPAGKKLFASFQRGAATRISLWSLRYNSGNNRYATQFGRLYPLIIVYAMTGHAHLGEFIHSHVMQAVRLHDQGG